MVLEGVLVGFLGGVFATFRFGEDGVAIVAGDGGLQIDPAAVEGAGKSGAVFLRVGFAER